VSDLLTCEWCKLQFTKEEIADFIVSDRSGVIVVELNGRSHFFNTRMREEQFIDDNETETNAEGAKTQSIDTEDFGDEWEQSLFAEIDAANIPEGER